MLTWKYPGFTYRLFFLLTTGHLSQIYCCADQNFLGVKQTLGYVKELGRNDVVRWQPPGSPLAMLRRALLVFLHRHQGKM